MKKEYNSPQCKTVVLRIGNILTEATGVPIPIGDGQVDSSRRHKGRWDDEYDEDDEFDEY